MSKELIAQAEALEWALALIPNSAPEARGVCRGRIEELRAQAAEQPAEQSGDANPSRLWLWRNFVNGRPEYWAFDNPYPIHLDYDDPMTIGEPCGYAFVFDSRNGRPDVSEEEVLRTVERVNAAPPEKKKEQPAEQAVAWMADDGRVCNARTKSEAMHRRTAESFNIPLYARPDPQVDVLRALLQDVVSAVEPWDDISEDLLDRIAAALKEK